MAMFGMDIADVRALATQLQSSADQITTIVGQLTSKLQATTWVGPDRQRFESDWQGHHVTALNQVANALTEASSLASKNADQQEQASA